MEFRTKREAEEAAQKHEAFAKAFDQCAEDCPVSQWGLKKRDGWRFKAKTRRTEAARIRAMLHALPE